MHHKRTSLLITPTHRLWFGGLFTRVRIIPSVGSQALDTSEPCSGLETCAVGSKCSRHSRSLNPKP